MQQLKTYAILITLLLSCSARVLQLHSKTLTQQRARVAGYSMIGILTPHTAMHSPATRRALSRRRRARPRAQPKIYPIQMHVDDPVGKFTLSPQAYFRRPRFAPAAPYTPQLRPRIDPNSRRKKRGRGLHFFT